MWKVFKDLGTVVLSEIGDFDQIDARITTDGERTFLNIGKSYLNFDEEMAPCPGRLMIQITETTLLNFKALSEKLHDSNLGQDDESTTDE